MITSHIRTLGIMWAGFIMMAGEENTEHSLPNFLPIYLHMLPTAVLLYIMAPVFSNVDSALEIALNTMFPL